MSEIFTCNSSACCAVSVFCMSVSCTFFTTFCGFVVGSCVMTAADILSGSDKKIALVIEDNDGHVCAELGIKLGSVRA